MVDKDESETLKEIRMLQELKGLSERVIDYIEDFPYCGIKRCIVTEFCSNGDLDGVIEQFKANKKNIPINKITFWNWEILEAIVFLHSKKIIHRDIKPKYRNKFIWSP